MAFTGYINYSEKMSWRMDGMKKMANTRSQQRGAERWFNVQCVPYLIHISNVNTTLKVKNVHVIKTFVTVVNFARCHFITILIIDTEPSTVANKM